MITINPRPVESAEGSVRGSMGCGTRTGGAMVCDGGGSLGGRVLCSTEQSQRIPAVEGWQALQ